MKSSLALWAGPGLAIARRLLWLTTWLLWLPMAVYIPWLNQGHSLWLLQVAVAVRLRSPVSTYTQRHGLLYCLLSPVYFWLKALIGVVAVVNHLSGSRVWHVTARTKTKPKKWRVALRGVK